MKTANDFAQAAIQIGQLADKITPADVAGEQDPYAMIRKLTVFHLRAAAGNMRQVAEALAK